MTTFKDVVGPKFGAMMEEYWPYGFLLFSICLILYQIGIWKIIYKLMKQAVVMSIMLLCCTIWYVLMTQHVTTLTSTIGTTAILSAINDAISGNPSQLMSNSKIMDPLTEILVISGATLFLLGVLYRQLPIDLIPDCIPCIGNYDNMMAALCAFCGFIICSIGIYCQWNYSNSPNSTAFFVQFLKNGTNYMDAAQGFIKNDDVNKWDNVMLSGQRGFQRATAIVSQSFQLIYNQIAQTINNSTNIPQTEL